MIHYKITREIARKLSRQLSVILLFILVGLSYQYSVNAITLPLAVLFIFTLVFVLFLNNKVSNQVLIEHGQLSESTARIDISILYGLGTVSLLYGIVATMFSLTPPSEIFFWISLGMLGISSGMVFTSSFERKKTTY